MMYMIPFEKNISIWGNGLFEGFYIQQRCDPELTPCQCDGWVGFNGTFSTNRPYHAIHVNVNSSLTPYVLHHHVMSLVCMSVVKTGKFIRPTAVFYMTDLLYWTQHKIQITGGSGSMNESLIDTVGCLCSIAVCFCYPLFHNEHICICCVWKEQPCLSG